MGNCCLCCTESDARWWKTCESFRLCSHFFACVLRRLSSRLDSIKRTACGDGQSHCLLCGASFAAQGVTAVLCVQCKKVGGYLNCFCLNGEGKQTLHLLPEDVKTPLHGKDFCLQVFLQCCVDPERFPMAISTQWPMC